ncbi:MAG: hypothetical protein NT028_11500 [candidate division Zixibacteria bacterium]|nr:hypothetical protein [candidate division Zixibacteria bacterium]
MAAFFDRNRLAYKKRLWRLFHNYSPNATTIYILGAQRSGTTLLLDCLERSMDFEVFGETSQAMLNYRIRSDDFIRQTVRDSHHKFVVFKPLTDSHRAGDFLNLLPRSFGIWAFRRVEDRVNSAVAKFGDHNLQVLTQLARGEGIEKWQAQGLTESDFQFIRGFDYSTMSPHGAAALFWYLRNSLFFNCGLQAVENVLPIAYEDLVASPMTMLQNICQFVGAEYRSDMVSRVHAQSVGRAKSNLPSEIVDICQPLYDRLHRIQMERLSRLRSASS